MEIPLRPEMMALQFEVFVNTEYLGPCGIVFAKESLGLCNRDAELTRLDQLEFSTSCQRRSDLHRNFARSLKNPAEKRNDNCIDIPL